MLVHIKAISLSIITIAALTACGGGGGTSTELATATFNGIVIDGAIEGASVCLDLNNNLTCDSGEPSDTTKADGTYSLVIDGLTTAQIRSAHIIATVPVTAKDADDGGKTLAQSGKSEFNLMAPAEAFVLAEGKTTPAVVSPLTTMVSHEMMSGSGKSVEAAKAAVVGNLGLPISAQLLENYVGKTDAANVELHVHARFLASALGEVKKAIKAADTPTSRSSSRNQQLAALVYLKTNAKALITDAKTAALGMAPIDAIKVSLTKISPVVAATLLSKAQIFADSSASMDAAPATWVSVIDDGLYSAACTGAATPTPVVFMPSLVTPDIGSLATISGHAQALAANLPTGGVVGAGSAVITTSGSAMKVTQTTQDLVVNWNSFNIGTNAAVQFAQPNASSISLLRVTSDDPSSIFGSLTSNGKVFLVNPMGVLFGASGRAENLSTVVPVRALVIVGFGGSRQIGGQLNQYTCSEWSHEIVRGNGPGKWSWDQFASTSAGWEHYTPSTDPFKDLQIFFGSNYLLGAKGWITDYYLNVGSYSADVAGGTVVSNDATGLSKRVRLTSKDVGGKKVSELIRPASRLNYIDNDIMGGAAGGMPASFKEAVLPSGSKYYAFNSEFEADAYYLGSQQESVLTPSTAGYTTTPLTSFTELIAAYTDNSASGGNTKYISIYESYLDGVRPYPTNLTFDAGGSPAGGTMSVFKWGDVAPYANTKQVEKGSYEIRTVFGEQVLVIVPPPSVLNARAEPQKERFFVVRDGKLYEGDYESVAYRNFRSVGGYWNKIAINAILAAAGLPAAK